MFNPHPALTGFPFVLLVILAVVEFFRLVLKRPGLDKTAEVLLLALAVTTPLTFFSGYLGASDSNRSYLVDPDIIERHRAVGRLLVISLVPTILTAYLRRSILNKEITEPRAITAFYLFFLTASLSLAVWTGYRGGDLVFEHGAGVQVAPPAALPLVPGSPK